MRIAEVAKKAGVSVATVSRALSKPEMVAVETRVLIEQVADELGYRPNLVARNLRRGHSRMIGVLISDILNHGNALLFKGIQEAASHANYTVFMFNTDEEASKERRALESLAGHMPQGLIVMPTSGARETLKAIGVPVIELDRASGLKGAHTVTVDNYGGSLIAVQHLIALGHKRIGMVVGDYEISTAIERHQGYKAALDGAGIKYRPDFVTVGHHREEGGHRAALELLKQPKTKRPTALFVGNNEMTIGAVLAVRELGLQIPEDISLIGFDDSRWAMTMSPRLTVVAQPAFELGKIACEILLDMLNKRHTNPSSVRLNTTFIERESTAPPGS